MPIYLISYDLFAPTSNRESVEKSIKSLGEWCKPLSTTFLVKTALDIDTVQKKATSNLDQNDKMMILVVTGLVVGPLDLADIEWIWENNA